MTRTSVTDEEVSDLGTGKESCDDARSISSAISRRSNRSEGSERSETAIDPESPSRITFPPGHPLYDSMNDPTNFDMPKDPVPGWPQLAALMSKTPDFASFNRFSDFQIKSLLYYQAELEMLKKELKEEELEDYRRGDEDTRLYSKRADYLISSRGGKNSRQWDLIVKMRVVLKEYNDALLQFSQVSALPQPESHNVNSLRTWLSIKEAGHFCIGGTNEQNTWGDLYDHAAQDPSLISLPRQFWRMVWSFFWSSSTPLDRSLDLASTVPARAVDGFSRWVATDFVPFWDNWREYRNTRKVMKTSDVEMRSVNEGTENRRKTQAELEKETLRKYSENNIMRVTSSISTVVACLLPTIAITVLSQLHGTQNLLICLAGFAIIFATGLIFLGTASKVEIFGATAAFSAVMVVFISVPIVIVGQDGKAYIPGT